MNDAKSIEDLFDEVNLTGELWRNSGTTGFVLGVFSGAKSASGKIPCHRDVGGLLVTQQVDKHRDEAMHCISVLPRRGGEVLDRQGVKSPEGHRMPVKDHEDGLRRLAHIVDFRGRHGQRDAIKVAHGGMLHL